MYITDDDACDAISILLIPGDARAISLVLFEFWRWSTPVDITPAGVRVVHMAVAWVDFSGCCLSSTPRLAPV